MQIKYMLLIFCIFGAMASSGQTEKVLAPDAQSPSPGIYTYVEKMPVAGYNYHEYLGKNIRYPDNARENNIQGKVIIKFLVNEDGSISDCKVIRGVDSELDKEVLRVVKSFPPWKPGMQNGKPVKVWYTLPIFIDPQ